MEFNYEIAKQMAAEQMAQKYDFSDLYRGVTPDFDEKQYLSAVSRVRYEVKKNMIQNGLLMKNDQLGESCVVDSSVRINKNGGIAIEFMAGKPFRVITPYGAFRLRFVLSENFVSEKEEKCFKELDALFGLVPVEGNLTLMAITKLPWQEKNKEENQKAVPTDNVINKTVKQSLISRVFPWPRKKAVVETKSVASKENTTTVKNAPKFKLGMSSDIYRIKRIKIEKLNYVNDVDMKELYEERHINQVLAEVNAEFMEKGHPEYILPTDSYSDVTKCLHNGKEYAFKGISRINNCEEQLNESEETQKQEKSSNIPVDLGREM